MLKLGSEIAGLGGDEQFVKTEASGKIYQGIYGNNIIFLLN